MTGEPSEAPSDARVDDAAPERLTAEDMFARRRAALNQAMQAEMVGGVVDAVVDETVDQVVDDSLDNPPDDAEDDPDIWSREALARELQRGPYEETPTYPLPTMTPEAEELLARGLSPASSDVPDADAPADMVGLADETVARVHEDGADVYQGPDRSEPVIGSLEGGEFVPVTGLVWRQDTWLQTPWWEQPQAWLVGEETDFARSTAYSQVVEAWYASEAVMRFRRDLVRDIMRVRSADQDRIAAIETLDSDTLSEMEENLAEQTMLSGYHGLWRLARHLGLPDRFRQLPVQPQPPETFLELEINGFGPCRYAFENWPVFYGDTRGLHSGVDFLAPAGTPLIAVADGRIVDFVPLGDPNDRSLALRPYLPEHFRTGIGGRVLSNVIVVYQHLNGDPENALVQVGDDVQAGQIIGTSGWPVHTWEDGTRSIQYNNAHVHIAVHLVTDGTGALGHTMPFNPLLFWSPRMVAWQARLATHSSDRPYPHSGQPFGRLGFFSVGAFRVGDDLPDFWTYEPSVVAPWPPDVYPLDELLETMQAWPAYPQDGITAI